MDHDEDDPLREAELYDDFLDGKIQKTPYLELEKREAAPAQPDEVSDEDLSRELTNLIWGLADLGIYISDTDHLSDRELYTELLRFADEPGMFFPGNKRASFNWSPIGSMDDADTQIYLRFYADDATRKRYNEDYGEPLPPKEAPPYPRPWIPVWNPFIEDEEEG